MFVSALSGVRQDRPLKYETTRPISAPKLRSNSPKGAARVKVEGSKVAITGQGKTPAIGFTANESINRVLQENKALEMDMDLSLEDFNYDDYMKTEKEKSRADKELEQLMRVDIKKPESVKQYEENMVILQEMEQNFKQSTLDLQKKLGLPIDGFV